MSIKFLTFGNVVRTAMMPVFGAIGVICGLFVGEFLNSQFFPEIDGEVIPRMCAIFFCMISALIGAILRLRWEQYEHEKKHNDALHLID